MHTPTFEHLAAGRSLRAWLAATALAATLAACAGGAVAPAVPTAPGSSVGATPQSSAAAGASPGASLDPEDAILAYTRCMREHGVDMPDPQVQGGGATGAGGGVAIQVTGDPASGAFKDASKACDSLLPKMGTSVDPKMAQEFADEALKLAHCMREHGIDMPDPQIQDGGAVAIGGSSSDFDPTSPKFQDAAKACRMGAGTTVTVGGGQVAPRSTQP